MSKIEVNTLSAGRTTEELNNMCRELEIHSSSIADICSGLHMNSSAAAGIKRRLRKNAADVEAESLQAKSLSDTLQQIMELYAATENAIVNSRENSQTEEKRDWKDFFQVIDWPKMILVPAPLRPWMILKDFEKFFEPDGEEDVPFWTWNDSWFGNRTDKDDKNFWEAFWGEVETDGWNDWDWKHGDVGIGGYFNGEGGVFHTEGEGDLGKYLHGEGAVSLLAMMASGRAGAQLFKDGKFQPGVYVMGEAEAHGAKIEGSGHLGTENNNVHVGAEGNGLYAGAKAQGGLGYLGRDSEGKDVYGAIVEFGAEAYLAKGEVKGGFSIFGIDVDLAVEGKFAGVQTPEAKLGVTNQEIEIGAGLGLGVGLEAKISVDWTDFEMPEIDWPDFDIGEVNWPDWDWPW